MKKPPCPVLRPVFAAILPALLLAGCNTSTAPAEPPPLAGADIGGPFTLQNSQGEPVRWSDFDGKYRIVYFGYTYCPDACPLDVSRMIKGYNQFKQADPALAAKVQPIFISIDPGRDTPEKVGQFTEAFSSDLIGLTGTPEQIDATVKAFKAFYARGEDGGNNSYLMDHSRAAYLMGPQGEPIALLPIDDSPEAVAAELEEWVS